MLFFSKFMKEGMDVGLIADCVQKSVDYTVL